MRSLFLVALLAQLAGTPPSPQSSRSTISGHVVTFPGVNTPQAVIVRVYGQSTSEGGIVLRAVPVRSDGTFEIPDVAPGEFNVSAGNPLRDPSHNFTFRSGNVTDLEVKVAAQVSGRVVFEDSTPYTAGNLTVFARTPAAGTNIHPGAKWMRSNARVDSAGNFSIALFPGDNTFDLSEFPEGYTIRSITYQGLDVRQSPLRLDEQPTSTLLITLSRQ